MGANKESDNTDKEKNIGSNQEMSQIKSICQTYIYIIKLYHLGDALKQLEFAFALVPCSNSYETHNIITIISCTGWAKSCEFL